MEVNKQLRLQRWAANMQEQQELGLTNQQYANRIGISTRAYEYRCRKVRAAMQEMVDSKESRQLAPVQSSVATSEFTRVELKSTSSMVLRESGISINVDCATIHIGSDSNLEHVKLVLEALAYVK